MPPYPRYTPHEASKWFNKYHHVYLPLGTMAIQAIANASDQADIAAEDAITSGGGGDPSPGEVNSTGIMGLHIDADGDDTRVIWPIPDNCDVKYDMGFRVWWSSASTTATDGITWKVLYDEITPESEAVAAGTTALSTAIAEDTNNATAHVLQITAWGKLNGGTLTNGRALSLIVECDAGDMTYGSEATYGYWLEIRYVRRVA